MPDSIPDIDKELDMQDESNTKDQLLAELHQLRKRVAQLEKEQKEHRREEPKGTEPELYVRAILQTTADGFCVIDRAKGRLVEVNEAYCRMTGYSRTELLSLRIADIEAPEEPDGIEARMRRIMENGSEIFETRHRRKNGSLFDVEVSSAYLEMGGGRFVCFFRDITERKQADLALRESEEQFRAMFETASIGMAQADPTTGQWLRVNRKMCEITGYRYAEMLSMRISEITHPEDRHRDWKAFQNVVSGKSENYRLEKRYIRKDASIVWVSVNMTVIRDSTGQPRRTMATIEDITERKRTEEALQESQRQLKHLSSHLLRVQEKERERIANEIHDSIGQSLHAIKVGLTNLAHEEGALPKDGRSLKDLLSTIDFAIDEVRNIYTGLRPSVLDDLGILTAISWFLREFQNTYSNISIGEQIRIREADVPEPLKIVIFRVLQAALDNVARHSSAKSVEVSFLRKDSSIELLIQDHGIGFNLEDAPFGKSGMRGLGLATMQERIESSGGVFTVKSIKGRGTAIKALWPRYR
jgi:PAS domain S-box-containing protein